MLQRSACKAMLFAEDSPDLIRGFGLDPNGNSMFFIPSLEECLKAEPAKYNYTKLFPEARNDPVVILHSSGSTGKNPLAKLSILRSAHDITGDPKLVTITNGALATVDNDRNVPVPEGRQPGNAMHFSFPGGGKFFSCFPPYHVSTLPVHADAPRNCVVMLTSEQVCRTSRVCHHPHILNMGHIRAWTIEYPA